jgi:hypothetical protein
MLRAVGRLKGGGSSGLSVDLFGIVGQSNAEGRGTSAEAPGPVSALFVSGSTVTTVLADPVGGASTGSMWPQFAHDWKRLTGRKAAFVECAEGGTKLLPDTAGSNWSPSGSLRGAAVTAINNAITTLDGSAFVVNNVYLLWCQGEGDAASINGTTITGPLYEQALEDLATYFKSNIPDMVTMGVIQTGKDADDATEDDFAAIRLAQENACTDSANLVMLYRGAFSFDARGMMEDNVHWSQEGLNLAGKCSATALSSGTAAIPTAPGFIASTSYADSSYATAATSRSADHTTSSGTKMLVVAVAAIRAHSNAVFWIDTVTFGGVAMTRVDTDRASSNGTTLSRATASIFYLNESDYGSSLSGVTQSVVVTGLNAQTINLIDWCAIDCDAEGVPESFYFYSPSPANVDTGTAAVCTNTPALVVGLGSSAAASATALTATHTNLTEVMDHGLDNGSGRAGQMTVGYAEEAAIVTEKTYSALWTASCASLVWVVAAFRGLISGEE